MTINNFKNILKKDYNIIHKDGYNFTKRKDFSFEEDIEISNIYITQLTISDCINYDYYLKELNFMYHTFFKALKQITKKTNFEILWQYYKVHNFNNYYTAKRNCLLYTKPLKFYFDLMSSLVIEDKEIAEQIYVFIKNQIKEATNYNTAVFNFILTKFEEILQKGTYTI